MSAFCAANSNTFCHHFHCDAAHCIFSQYSGRFESQCIQRADGVDAELPPGHGCEVIDEHHLGSSACEECGKVSAELDFSPLNKCRPPPAAPPPPLPLGGNVDDYRQKPVGSQV